MKDKYTIGEVAELLGMSSQTLRFYDKEGLVVPDYTNPQTGYRYYSYDQIHYIDRIKYLQHFGFSLEDIKTALNSNDTDRMRALLANKKEQLKNDIASLEKLMTEIDWYSDYYDYPKKYMFGYIPYMKDFEDRYILAEKFQDGEDIYGTAGQRLTKLRYSGDFSEIEFLRQTGYLLDAGELLKGNIVPRYYFMYFKGKPKTEHPNIMMIKGGSYICQQSRILAEKFKPELLHKFFNNADMTRPQLAVADEYEDNFRSFRNCMYEVQLLVR